MLTRLLKFGGMGRLFTSIAHTIFLRKIEQAQTLKGVQDSATVEGRRGR